ncbi:hypothetical protein AVEN_244728-1 [Araneus ventricosus]|uniref:Uncharacterized protein n=1 Tax=Araneus ventricosus TaxID=182803 RepID=A0A4Y2BRC4_ARAVE|nr:hypothetical protein AVEN_244728-1 [Araneus ventricosus]
MEKYPSMQLLWLCTTRCGLGGSGMYGCMGWVREGGMHRGTGMEIPMEEDSPRCTFELQMNLSRICILILLRYLLDAELELVVVLNECGQQREREITGKGKLVKPLEIGHLLP